MTDQATEAMHGGTLDRGRVMVVDTDVDLVTVKVWELPVRITHWLIFAAVLVLMVTGYYIGNPFIRPGSADDFLMGDMRLAHFIAAWVFMLSVAARIIWAFIGNHWANWRQFVPVQPHRRRWARETLKFYLFVRREPPPAVGHNPLAGATYTLVYLMFVVVIITGLGMMSLNDKAGWQWFVSGWIFSIFSEQIVRLIHHAIMWLTAGFVIHHIFSAVLVDLEERTGILSSIVTGYKRVPRERL